MWNKLSIHSMCLNKSMILKMILKGVSGLHYDESVTASWILNGSSGLSSMSSLNWEVINMDLTTHLFDNKVISNIR